MSPLLCGFDLIVFVLFTCLCGGGFIVCICFVLAIDDCIFGM